MKKFILSLTFFGFIFISAGLMAQLPNIAIVASDSAAYMPDVQAKLSNTGFFGVVDIIDVRSMTPTLATLQGYDAILAYTQFVPFDATLLGDNLAAYIESGGGVVASTFFNVTTWRIAGSFEANYQLLSTVPDLQNLSGLQLGMNIIDGSHPVMTGVTTFDGGTASFHSGAPTILNGGTTVASWTDGEPLVVVAEDIGPGNVRRVDLNFWPASSDARPDLWNSLTDGGLIMGNALLWVAGYDRPGQNSLTTAGSGTITDGSNQFDYINNETASWQISPAGALSLTLDFNSFDTESCCDFLTVYNGPNNGSPIIGTYGGTTLPGTIVSSGGSLFLEFTTDGSITSSGWEVEYSTNEFSTIGIIGDASPIGDFVTDVDMIRADPIGEPHIWTLNANLNTGLLKFRAGNSWATNWGELFFPFGRGVQDGPDIPVVAGNYNIRFNSNTGEYRLVESGFAASVLNELHGGSSKQWILDQNGLGFGIGPEPGTLHYWNFGVGGSSTYQERPCAADDIFTFDSFGNLGFDSNESIWLDNEGAGGWNDALGANQCHDESEPGLWVAYDLTDVSAFDDDIGAYTYTYDPLTSTLTVNGSGFYIAYSSKSNTLGENFPVPVKEYIVTAVGGGQLQLSLPVDEGLEGYWTANLTEIGPPAPTPSLRAFATSISSIDLEWDDVLFETSYVIERSTDDLNYAIVTTVGESVTSYTDPILGINTIYYYRIRAQNAFGESADTYAEAATFSTALTTNFDFNNFYGGAGFDNVHGISTDDQGNFYVTGRYNDQIDFLDGTPLVSTNGIDQNSTFLVKFASDGTLIWDHSIDPTIGIVPRDVHVAADNSVYITGYFYGDLFFAGTTITSTLNTASLYLLKLDTNGNEIWARTVSSPWFTVGDNIGTDDLGNIYLGGYVPDEGVSFGGNTVSSRGGVMYKWDQDGNELLLTHASMSTTVGWTEFQSLVVGIDGIYVTGDIFGSTDFGNGVSVNIADDGDMFVAKYDFNGNAQWIQVAGGDDYDVGRDLTIDDSGNVFVTGYFRSSQFDGPGFSFTNNGAGNGDIFIIKFDQNGNHFWSQTHGNYPDDFAFSITTDGQNIYTTGKKSVRPVSFGGLNIDNGTFFLTKYLPDGTVEWVEKMEGSDITGYELDYHNGRVYMAGNFTYAANFGSFTSLSNTFSRDIHVATISVGTGGGSAITEYSNNFNTSSGDFIGDFTIETPTGFNDGALHSPHPYTEGVDGNSADFISQLIFPITLNASNAIMTFDEIVLVEDGDPGTIFGQSEFWDYVIVEGSSDDGLTWLPFLDGYDCRADADWETLYNETLDGDNSTGVGSPDLFRGRIINLVGNGNFSGGEDVLIRFRLNSDDFAVGWGWAIDNLNIQLSSAPVVTLQSPPSSYEIGTGGVTITANVTDDDVLDAVLFAYGKISEITDDFDQSQYNVIFPEEISQGVFEHRLVDSDFDDVGVQYYFGAIDLAGNVGLSSPLPATVSVAFPDGSINLSDVSPVSDSGNPTETDYRIFSVPVRSVTVANVFGDPGVDKNQWRAWRYSGSNSELTSSSSLSAGNGYWLIYQSTAGLALNVGGVAVDASNSNPFTINLNSGINLIGNPFRFTISWQEVLDHNIAQGIINPADVSGLTFYRGGFNSASNADLQVTEGAFVQSNEAFSIEIPISSNAFARVGNNTRTSKNSLDEDDWEVGINLANEATFYNVAAVGMNPEAEEGRDKFDQMAMPFLFRYLEFNSANEEFINERVSKDVVKTTEDYVWEFEATTSFDPSEASLSWDNSYFGDNDQQLYLYDLKEERIINMREQTEYRFFLRDKQNFKILYGSPEFIEATLKPGDFTLGHAYPNPFADMTRIPFSLSAENDLYKVQLMVYNNIGELINVLVEDDYQCGFYAVDWDGTNEFGQQVSEGIYIYKLRITHKNGSDELTGKLIYRN